MMDFTEVIEFLLDNRNKMQKWNATGICLSSGIVALGILKVVPIEYTLSFLVYIFGSSALFAFSKRKNAAKIPEAVCPFCGAPYEISKFKCTECGREI